MFELRKRFSFDAAHKLPGYDGKCANLHGHTWQLEISVRGNLVKKGPKKGMVLDFSDIKKVVQDVLDLFLDHHYLNDSLGEDCVTCEKLARWLYKKLKGKIPGLHSVELWETPTSSCFYTE